MATKLAQATGYITVVDDVISIKSADVVFAIGSNNVNPPVDGDNWKTTFAELSMTSDGYVWTCTKITKTDDSVEYSGKYCLGACSDFASIIELYALGDSNINPPADNVGWKQSYTPVKGKWLWTRNELHFQNSSEVVLTTPVCIGYFAEDGTNGTSFKFKGVAYGHFDKASSSTGFKLNEYFLLDKDDVSEPNIPSPCVGIYSRFGGVVKLSTDKADVGDAYRIDTSLWVNNGDEWVNFGDIQGPQGEAGEDAIWTVLSPRQITFESNEKGVVEDEVKYVDLTVFLGSTIITQSCNISFLDVSNSNFNNSKATVVKTNSSTSILVQSTGIASKKINDNLIITNPYSFLRVKVSYEDYVLTFDIGIVVDTSVQDGYFHTSINGLDAKYSKIKSSTDSLTTTVTTQQGIIEANSTNITLTNNQLKETNEIVNGINTTVSEWNEAGVITYKDYAGLFATYSKGEIATKAEMSVAIDNGISKATIDADRININAGHKLSVKGNCMTIDTDNFKLKENGDVTITGTVNAVSGSIGNLKITDQLYSNNTGEGSVKITPTSIQVSGAGDDWANGSLMSFNASGISSFAKFYGIGSNPVVTISNGMVNGYGGGPTLKLDTAYAFSPSLILGGFIHGFSRGTCYFDDSDSIITKGERITGDMKDSNGEYLGSCFVYGGAGNKTIYLEGSNTYAGDEIVIMNESSKAITIKIKSNYVSSSMNVMWVNGYSGKISEYNLGAGSVIHGIYTGNYWHLW